MAKKDKKGRLVIPSGYLNVGDISSSDELLFVNIDQKRIAIIKDSTFDELKRRRDLSSRVVKLLKCKLEKNEKFEFCITIPNDVDAILGKGKQYYFSIFEFSLDFKPFLCINK